MEGRKGGWVAEREKTKGGRVEGRKKRREGKKRREKERGNIAGREGGYALDLMHDNELSLRNNCLLLD